MCYIGASSVGGWSGLPSRQAKIESNGGHRNDHTEQTISADLHSSYERKSAARAAKAVGASGRAVAQAKTVARDAALDEAIEVIRATVRDRELRAEIELRLAGLYSPRAVRD